MFARRISATVRSGGLEELVSFVEEVRTTEVEQEPGFIGGVLMSNTQSNEVAALTFWDTEAEMMATKDTDEFTLQIATVAHLLTSPRTIEHFDVRLRFGKMFDE
jgi:heme-degrading monooxygenase HmoA